KDGIHHGIWGHPSGTAHADFNIAQLGGYFLRRVLVRNCPTRCARGCSQTALGTKVIDFDDHTIHLKFGIVAMICPVLDLVLDFLRCRDPLRIRRNRKAPRRNGSVGIVLARGSKAFTSTETMCYQTQTTL